MPDIIMAIDQGTTGTTVILLDRELNIKAHGCFRVVGALQEMVARSEKRLVVAISSHMGSIAETEFQ